MPWSALPSRTAIVASDVFSPLTIVNQDEDNRQNLYYFPEIFLMDILQGNRWSPLLVPFVSLPLPLISIKKWVYASMSWSQINCSLESKIGWEYRQMRLHFLRCVKDWNKVFRIINEGTIIVFLDIIHRPVFIKNNISETGFCLRLLLEAIQLGPLDTASLCLRFFCRRRQNPVS
jgi:hypothetical protein